MITHKRAIENSIKQWAPNKKAGVRSIIGWLTQNNTDNDSLFRNLRRSMNQRWKDGRQKERRHNLRKRLSDHPSRQVKLAKFFTLTRSD